MSKTAPTFAPWRSRRAEKTLVANPMCAALIGVPSTAMSQLSALASRSRTRAWTKRNRIDSFQPSPLRSSPPGKNTSSRCRLFCIRRRRAEAAVSTRPVVANDLAISVENPSIRTPATNAIRTLVLLA